MHHKRIIAEVACATRDNSETQPHAPEQLGLRYDSRYLAGEQWGRVLDAFAGVVREVGLKTAAYELDVQPSVLAHAIAERERHYVRAEWLVWAVAKARTPDLAEALVAPGGLTVKPKHKLSDAEYRQRLEAWLAANPAIGRVVREGALGGKP